MTSKELREQRAALVAKMNEISGKDPFDQVAWEKADVDQKALEVRIKAVEQSDALDKELRSFTPLPSPIHGSPKQNPIEHRNQILNSEEYRDAFRNYATTGNPAPLQEMETRTGTALTETTTGGGYLIPIGFQKELEIRLKAYGNISNVARHIVTATGNQLNWPTWDDVGNKGEWVAINSDATTGAALTFGQVQFNAYLASSKQVLVPVQLLQDSAFDLQSELSEAFAIRIGRLLADAYTSGTGSGQPTGICYAGQIIAANVVTAVGDDLTSGNTDLNSIGTNDLVNLTTALDPAYRKNAIFMANQASFDALRKLRDKYGRPLWQVDITQGEPDSIFGYKFQVNQSMASVGVGAKPMVFGDFSKYIIRDVLGITMVRFNELYMGSYQVGFQAYLRTDAQNTQPYAFSELYTPLS